MVFQEIREIISETSRHAPSFDRRRTEKVIAVCDVLEYEIIVCQTAFIQYAGQLSRDLSVDGVSPIPCSPDVSCRANLFPFLVTEIILTARVPRVGIVVNGGSLRQVVALTDNQ